MHNKPLKIFSKNRIFQKVFILVNFYSLGSKMAEVVKNLFKVVFGVLLVIVAIWFATWQASWGKAALDLIKGGLVILVVLIGFVLLLIGFSDLKNAE
jgi:hypothetical protein